MLAMVVRRLPAAAAPRPGRRRGRSAMTRASAEGVAPPAAARVPAPAWLPLLVAALTLAHLAAAPWAALHLDLARDLFVAQEIVAGRALPMQGPLLAQAFQLGPVWFHAQALVLALGGSLAATATVLVAANSLKIPLAWRLGTRLAGPWTGLLWAALIALPGWHSLMTVFGLHPGLVEPLALACLLACLCLVREGGRACLAVALLALSLAVNAHPTAILLAGFVVAAVALRWRAHGPDLPGMALALGLAAVPWLPLLFAAGDGGEVGTAGIPGLVAAQLRQLGALPGRLAGLAQAQALGLPYWLRTVAGLPAAAALGCALLLAALLAVLLLRAAPRWRRRAAWATAGALLASATALVAMRDTLPYYHLGAFWVVLSGALAVACGGAATTGTGRRLVAGLALLALALATLASAAVVRQQRDGAWPLAFAPMFDLYGAASQPAPRAFLMPPVHALDRLGRAWCRSAAGSVHGPLANHLFLGYGIEWRSQAGCTVPVAGGAQPGLLALPAHMARVAGDAGAGAGVASVVGYPVRRLLRPARAWQAPATPVYPPRLPAAGDDGRDDAGPGPLEVEAVLAAGERVLVGDLVFPVHADRPPPSAWLDGRPLPPAAGNGGSWLFVCDRDAGCAGAQLRLAITGPGRDWIEVLTF